MATNAMYRQLLSQAVSNNGSGNYHGSALLGGSGGGALIGGAYFGHKSKPKTERKSSISDEERVYRMANGTAKMSAEQYRKLHSETARLKAKTSRDRDTAHIDGELRRVYAGRKNISYGERVSAIAKARIENHERKLIDKKAELDRNPAKKAELKLKRQTYLWRAATKAGFPVYDTMSEPTIKAALSAYRKSKGYGGPKTPEQKLKAKQERAEFKAFKAAKAVPVAYPVSGNR